MARNGQWFPNPKNVSILSILFDECGGHEIVLWRPQIEITETWPIVTLTYNTFLFRPWDSHLMMQGSFGNMRVKLLMAATFPPCSVLHKPGCLAQQWACGAAALMISSAAGKFFRFSDVTQESMVALAPKAAADMLWYLTVPFFTAFTYSAQASCSSNSSEPFNSSKYASPLSFLRKGVKKLSKTSSRKGNLSSPSPQGKLKDAKSSANCSQKFADMLACFRFLRASFLAMSRHMAWFASLSLLQLFWISCLDNGEPCAFWRAAKKNMGLPYWRGLLCTVLFTRACFVAACVLELAFCRSRPPRWR